MTRLYNWKVRPRLIKIEDLVLRKAEVSDPTHFRGELASNWEGPYRVVSMVHDGTYQLLLKKELNSPKRGTYPT
ncbi:hypothetical protein BHE74_00057278 [Ensete ventricosum]|nr:hypothetical protein BHE74_00057278 [Ensete ventricosum]